MSLISILAPPPAPSSSQSHNDANTSGTGANPPAEAQGGGQTEDTAPPAPASRSTDSASATRTGNDTDSSAAARVDVLAPRSDASSARSAVEANMTAPDVTEADARRFAEAAQAKQRLALLIEAVQTPVKATALAAPAAAQAEAGPIQTEGTPV